MTSHHESGTQEMASHQRIEQLKLCFQRMMDAPSHRIVLFGGDLNMREKEVRIFYLDESMKYARDLLVLVWVVFLGELDLYDIELLFRFTC
jgi:hypothetical protein